MAFIEVENTTTKKAKETIYRKPVMVTNTFLKLSKPSLIIENQSLRFNYLTC